MSRTQCRQYLVSGRVQGVFFRASTERQARALGVTGHALNLPDGRVEVLACGSEQALSELEQWLQHGPPGARVDDLKAQPHPGPAPKSFATGKK